MYLIGSDLNIEYYARMSLLLFFLFAKLLRTKQKKNEKLFVEICSWIRYWRIIRVYCIILENLFRYQICLREATKREHLSSIDQKWQHSKDSKASPLLSLLIGAYKCSLKMYMENSIRFLLSQWIIIQWTFWFWYALWTNGWGNSVDKNSIKLYLE